MVEHEEHHERKFSGSVDELISLRGHHLRQGVLLVLRGSYHGKIEEITLNSLRAAGYGDEFSSQVVEIWSQLRARPDQEIKLIATLDDICLDAGCPRRRPACSSQTSSEEDIAQIESLGLELGRVYTVKQISETIRTKIEFLTPGLELDIASDRI